MPRAGWRHMNGWHYVQNGRGFGPVELAALQALIASGQIGPETLVWQTGMPNWVPTHTIPELAASIPVATPPPISMGTPRGTPMEEGPADVAQNKMVATLAYVGPLVIVPLLAAPNSKFARFHANQALALFLS